MTDNDNSTQCWPGAVENPNDSNQCIMPLRYYDPGNPGPTLYSWLTYQPKDKTGSNADLFAKVYGDVFSSNPSVADPDTTNQNRLNLYQPKNDNALYTGLQWVSAIYPNASIFEDSDGNKYGPDKCPTETSNIKDICTPGCSYWAHEYNLENVYMENDNNDNLVPKFPPRKALYGIVSTNQNVATNQPGQPVKYGDTFYMTVNLLDINPQVEQSVAKKDDEPIELKSRDQYDNMTLLIQNDPSYKKYIILGKNSSKNGGLPFNDLVAGDPAEFQIKSLNSKKADGDVVMSGDQFYMVKFGGQDPVKWETLQFSQAWHGNNEQSLIPTTFDSSTNSNVYSWMYSNRYYWQGSIFSPGTLQTSENPNRKYQQWYPDSTQGFNSNPYASQTDPAIGAAGPITPSGSILLFGDNSSDVPAVHWFLDATTGNPQINVKRQTCQADSDCSVSGEICDTSAGLCTNPPTNKKQSQQVILIAFFVIFAVVFVVVLYMGYKVYSKHKQIQTQQSSESRLESQLSTSFPSPL